MGFGSFRFGSSGGAWTVGLGDRSDLGRVEYGFGECNDQVGEFVNSVAVVGILLLLFCRC